MHSNKIKHDFLLIAKGKKDGEYYYIKANGSLKLEKAKTSELIKAFREIFEKHEKNEKNTKVIATTPLEELSAGIRQKVVDEIIDNADRLPKETLDAIPLDWLLGAKETGEGQVTMDNYNGNKKTIQKKGNTEERDQNRVKECLESYDHNRKKKAINANTKHGNLNIANSAPVNDNFGQKKEEYKADMLNKIIEVRDNFQNIIQQAIGKNKVNNYKPRKDDVDNLDFYINRYKKGIKLFNTRNVLKKGSRTISSLNEDFNKLILKAEKFSNTLLEFEKQRKSKELLEACYKDFIREYNQLVQRPKYYVDGELFGFGCSVDYKWKTNDREPAGLTSLQSQKDVNTKNACI